MKRDRPGNHHSDGKDLLIRSGWRGWLTLYGIWTVPMLILSMGYYYTAIGAGHEVNWWWIFLEFSSSYYLFASICPPIYRLTGKLRFTKPIWPLTLIVHIIVNILVVNSMLVLGGVQRALMEPGQDSFLEIIGRQFNWTAFFRSLMYYTVYYLVVVGAMLLIRWRRQRLRQEERTRELELKTTQLEAQLNTARLKTLRMQLRPHFLFNALNTISALVESGQNDRAFKMIAQLGDLLRASLKLPETSAITLKQELDFIEKYLTIERIRFSDRLKTRTDVPEECMEAMIPALILQPLVENCIHHAAAKQTKSLEVHIRAFVEKETLALEVSDDGPGLPEDWEEKARRRVGLGNVRQRLQMMYGDASSLELLPASPNGLTVRLGIPYSVTVTMPTEQSGDHISSI